MNDQQTSYVAEILSASERHFEDSGNVILGSIEAQVGDRMEIVRFRIDQARAMVRRIMFAAAGVAADAAPEALVGKRVRVVLAPWTCRDGSERLVVRKWLPAEPRPGAAKPAAPTAPAWERDAAAVARAPRRTTAAKAWAKFKANAADEDDIPPSGDQAARSWYGSVGHP
jgi:hypothetical protein